MEFNEDFFVSSVTEAIRARQQQATTDKLPVVAHYANETDLIGHYDALVSTLTYYADMLNKDMPTYAAGNDSEQLERKSKLFAEAAGELNDVEIALLKVHTYTNLKHPKLHKLVSNFFVETGYGLLPECFFEITKILGDYDYDKDVALIASRYGLKNEFHLSLDIGYAIFLLLNRSVPCFAFHGDFKKGFDCQDLSANVTSNHEIYLFKLGKQKAMNSWIWACEQKADWQQHNTSQ